MTIGWNPSILRKVDALLGVGYPTALRPAGQVRDGESTQRDEHVFERLTPSERSVLKYMAEGLSNEAIALELSLSLRTIESHVRSILGKVVFVKGNSINRRVCAVLFYLRAQH